MTAGCPRGDLKIRPPSLDSVAVAASIHLRLSGKGRGGTDGRRGRESISFKRGEDMIN